MTDTGETMGLRELAKAAFIKARAKPYKAEHEIAYPLGCYNQPPYFDAPWVKKEFRVFFEGFCAAAQQARIVELEAALKPFAEVAELYDSREADSFEVWLDVGPVGVPRKAFRLGHYRTARAALRKDPQQ